MTRAKQEQWVWYGQLLLEAGIPVYINTSSKRLRDQLVYVGVMRQIFKVRA